MEARIVFNVNIHGSNTLTDFTTVTFEGKLPTAVELASLLANFK